MRTRKLKPRKSIVKMDPDCAVCRAPAEQACDCEAKGLEMAVKQAEQKIMRSIYQDIRTWVRSQAQDCILEHFRQRTEQRKEDHSANLERISADSYHYHGAPPHPQTLADAQAHLKRGIDEDWQDSVQLYPDVLEYYFNLVEMTLPSSEDPAVQNPPLPALNPHVRSGGSSRKPRRAHEPPSALPPAGYSYMLNAPPSRTPPPPERYERRQPVPREREKRSRNALPPQSHAPYAPYNQRGAYMG